QRCRQDMTRAGRDSELMVHFLLLELETVGNIRFEEGSSANSWFVSCYDLILSRFCAADFGAFGVSGIKINRILRVHNRALRLRFEDQLHALLAGEESSVFAQNYKRWLDYLFYVPDPECAGEEEELRRIPEHGFLATDSYKALGRERAVPLANSLSLCERPRMQYLLDQAEARGQSGTDPLPFRHGQIVIAKAFLGHSVPAQDGQPVDSDSYPKAHSVFRNAYKGKSRPCSARPHGSCDCSRRQSEWFVFDHELVLPEYLIDFQYITEAVTPDAQLDGPAEDGPGVNSACEVSLDKEALSLEPASRPQPKMICLDKRSMLAAAQAVELSQITVLSLHGSSLSRLKEVSRLTALRRLTVSFSELTHLEDISHLPSLEFVDASFNHIVTLEGLRGLSRLKSLDLSWNRLSRAREEAAVLRKHVPALLTLDLRHNPWHRPESVRVVVLGCLKTLTHLDGCLVSEEEVALAVQITAGSRISQASLLAHSRTDPARPRCLSLLSAAQLLTCLNPSPWDSPAEPEPGWTSKITALNLDGQGLSRLTNLDQLVNLRWASFNDNDIARIEGLDGCRLLEELSLDHNCISRLEGLSQLGSLTRLSLNGNQLSSLEGGGLEKLLHLHFLSLENNRVGSLRGLHRARGLIELYLGHNAIASAREVHHIKGLSNLVILDLYGNPFTEQQENYRIFVIFHLPSLRALDGTAVEGAESEHARDELGGRLTPDMVSEKLGHSDYADVFELDIPSAAIRTVDLAPTDQFRSIRSVNLENNNLTSFSGLVFLPNVKFSPMVSHLPVFVYVYFSFLTVFLQVLCLNHNRIESILPRQKTQTPLNNRQMLYQKVNSSGYGQQGASRGSRDPGLGDSLGPLMASLEVLHLSHNGVSSLAQLQLSRLSNLKALFLQGNELSQIEGLEGLKQLRELALDRNRIKSVGESSFAGQAALVELHLAENRVRELGHLQPLPQLRRLFLSGNKIQDVSELEKLDVLPSLTELCVVGNPVSADIYHCVYCVHVCESICVCVCVCVYVRLSVCL
ncbi:LRRC9 protein, partial [Amia calva]|nr:LRRC9 protein [Amia calva]